MRHRIELFTAVIVFTLVLSAPVATQTTAFTYQGNLNLSGSPANGNFDFELALFDSLTGGTQTGPNVVRNNVPVTNGNFSVVVDFGSQFPGANRYLEIRVKPVGAGSFTALSPRAFLTSTPYAVRANAAAGADTAGTAINATQLGGVPAASYVVSGATAINAGTQFSISGSRILSAAGTRNTFVGVGAGTTTPNAFATDNSFIGFNSGAANTTGAANSFFGSGAGQSNVDGGENSFFGTEAGQLNSGGDGNSFFGRSAGKVNTTGSNNSFFGATAGDANTTGNDNAFFGRAAGGANTSGSRNSFFGRFSGAANIIGFDNAFFGYRAGQNNTENNNSFFGSQTGAANTSGGNNSIFGTQAGLANTTGSGNSIFGVSAGAENTVGIDNTFIGVNSGRANISGNRNTFIGRLAGRFNVTGENNTYIGYNAGSNGTCGTNNTLIGTNSNVNEFGCISNATAIGAGSIVYNSNDIKIGRDGGLDRVIIPGYLELGSIPAGGELDICVDNNGTLVMIRYCSSSMRYKKDVAPFSLGLELIEKLDPVTFIWKESGNFDLGLIAEDVAAIDPLLATQRNGEIEGVKYDRIGVVLINAVKQQQEQIVRLERMVNEHGEHLEQMRRIICELKPEGKACRKE